jgi:hypothetical protein
MATFVLWLDPRLWSLRCRQSHGRGPLILLDDLGDAVGAAVVDQDELEVVGEAAQERLRPVDVSADLSSSLSAQPSMDRLGGPLSLLGS